MAWPFNFLGRLMRRSAQIEAGAGGRRWHGASTLAAPQSATLAARRPAKDRAAALSINSPYGARIVEAWASALIGKGWQARPGHPSPDERRLLADAFEAMAGPLLVPMARALIRDGEAFLHLRVLADGRFRPKLIPAEQVGASITRDLGDGRRIIAGVEFDGDDEVIAYHVLRDAPDNPLGAWGEAVRMPAGDVLHVYDQIFPGQIRGISWLAPALLKLRDRDETSDSLLMALKVQSLITGFISDPEGGAAGFEPDAAGGAVNVSLEPGAMRFLPAGSSVSFSSPGQGLAQAVDFLRAQDREIAAAVGITFEALTGDLGEANYSSARVGLLDFRRRAESLQRRLIEPALRGLWNRWIEVQALSGAIDPGRITEYRAVHFVAPGWTWVDPRNEVEAEIAAIGAGLKSREEVIAGRGRDPDELAEELARDALRFLDQTPKEAKP